jgi:hypothetical protein
VLTDVLVSDLVTALAQSVTDVDAISHVVFHCLETPPSVSEADLAHASEALRKVTARVTRSSSGMIDILLRAGAVPEKDDFWSFLLAGRFADSTTFNYTASHEHEPPVYFLFPFLFGVALREQCLTRVISSSLPSLVSLLRVAVPLSKSVSLASDAQMLNIVRDSARLFEAVVGGFGQCTNVADVLPELDWRVFQSSEVRTGVDAVLQLDEQRLREVVSKMPLTGLAHTVVVGETALRVFPCVGRLARHSKVLNILSDLNVSAMEDGVEKLSLDTSAVLAEEVSTLVECFSNSMPELHYVDEQKVSFWSDYGSVMLLAKSLLTRNETLLQRSVCHFCLQKDIPAWLFAWRISPCVFDTRLVPAVVDAVTTVNSATRRMKLSTLLREILVRIDNCSSRTVGQSFHRSLSHFFGDELTQLTAWLVVSVNGSSEVESLNAEEMVERGIPLPLALRLENYFFWKSHRYMMQQTLNTGLFICIAVWWEAKDQNGVWAQLQDSSSWL